MRNIDMGIFREFGVTERMQLQFRAEGAANRARAKEYTWDHCWAPGYEGRRK